jgi:hypothetical protein
MAYRYASRRSRTVHDPNIARVAARDKNTPPIAYLCKLAHDIPEQATLEQLHPRELSAYVPSIKGPSVTCFADSIVMATIARGKLTLSNVPTGITTYQAILSYHKLITSHNITILTRIRAFTIYTTPYDSYKRACSYLNASMLPDALLEFDNAIMEATSHIDDITDQLERAFSRYCKLRNLFFHNTEEHESKLALERALRAAMKIWETLRVNGA